jgi:hypothetical protein
MRSNKGQAALEFLMTYGWAILVVLIVIGALAYFGVLNPNILVPPKCTLETGLSCKDYRITEDKITLSLENGMGKGIVIQKVSVYQVGTGANMGRCLNGTTLMAVTVGNGREGALEIYCQTPLVNTGRKEKFDLNITYYYQDSTAAYNHTMKGEILAPLEG